MVDIIFSFFKIWLELALPYSPARPWPLPELFCFARVEEIGGEPHIIYAFDRRKAPIF